LRRATSDGTDGGLWVHPSMRGTLAKGGDRMNECVYCEGVADFEWLDGGWYVCTGCIKEGKTDTEAQGE